MTYEELEGALTRLKRVTDEDAEVLHGEMQEKGFYLEAGLRRPPKLKSLKQDLEDEALVLWKVFAENDDNQVGYAGFVTYSGPPYVLMYVFKDPVDLDLAQDCLAQLVPIFFRIGKDEQLYFFVDKPADERIDELLLEGGFDLEEEPVPNEDPDKVATYIMRRETFDAYYGDDEEDVEELEF